MTPKEYVDKLQEQFKMTREKSEADPDVTSELYTYISGVRRGDPFIQIMCKDRDSGLGAARIVAVGMCADMLSFTSEAWHAHEMTNPDTGEDWGPGEMQKYVEAHPDQEIIGSAINTFVVDRDFVYASRLSPFRVVEGKVEWSEEPDLDGARGDLVAKGLIPNTLYRIMGEVTLDTIMAEQGHSMEKVEADLGGFEARMWYQDRGCLREITDQGLSIGMMLMARPDSERSKLIEEKAGPPDGELKDINDFLGPRIVLPDQEG